jgi:hypothetical protein
LLWLIKAGYVIEFNDGSLDLPRAKQKPKEKEEESSVEAGVSPANERTALREMPAAEKEERVEAGAPAAGESSVGENPASEIGKEVGAIDPIARGRFGEPPLPAEEESEIGGS